MKGENNWKKWTLNVDVGKINKINREIIILRNSEGGK
jgi:hypothetical protein